MFTKRMGVAAATVAAGAVLLTACGSGRPTTPGADHAPRAAAGHAVAGHGSAGHASTGHAPAGQKDAPSDRVGTLSFDNVQLNTANVPPQFVAPVEAAANTCTFVDAPLLAAQLEQESDWDPNAQSPIGAQGLAQFKPEIWAQFGGDADGDGVNSPFDPEDAIAAQGRLMCDIFDRLQTTQLSGNLFVLGLWAYNAGLQATIDAGGQAPTQEAADYANRIENELLPKYTLSS